MIRFTISRLHTDYGIIKAQGLWRLDAVSNTQLTTLEQLSTDGWVELDISHPANSQFISTISPLIHNHLLSRQENPA
ncbi:hypothetical protein L2735_17870 [Shewanella olleyana]|uniref:hypothetical protein n=1 Tax=Shewanella olleyana TaxID=135626 RepID=UPI00200C2EAA|nr:hypothetical protein [Shewanella olleyana]MCL1068642.1 hypothetical protein [Shewanella olleyana]